MITRVFVFFHNSFRNSLFKDLQLTLALQGPLWRTRASIWDFTPHFPGLEAETQIYQRNHRQRECFS